MNRFIYTTLLRLASPIIFKLLERKAQRAGGVWEIPSPERFGDYAANISADHMDVFQRPVWVHAVSLGETRAAQPLIQALLDQGLPVLLTHMTATGREMGASFFKQYIVSGQLRQAWVPYDLPKAVTGFLNHWQPRCGILIEREVWPNLLAEAKTQEIPMLMVSARFSESTLKQSRWMGRVLRDAFDSLTLILAQTTEDEVRLRSYGLSQVKLAGNLKFDVTVVESLMEKAIHLKEQLQRPVVVIASTRDGEESMFINAISQMGQQAALYVVVPRHPQRFGEVSTLLDKSTLAYLQRSQQPSIEALRQCQVLLGDSVGEMFFYYGLADVAIIGGSFADFGGQNNIEASAAGVPVMVGPHTANFKQAVDDAIAVGATIRVNDATEAVKQAEQLLNHAQEREAMRLAAKQWMSQHRGATERTMCYLQPFLQ